MFYTEAYNEKIIDAWEKQVKNETYNHSFIRPEIFDSWVRSNEFLVDPYHMKKNILPPHALEEKKEENKELINTVKPYMNNIYNIVKGSGFYIMLTDKDGYILYIVGDLDIIEWGEKNTLLVEGANRSERYAGTNAIGTSIALKRSIQVWRGEHYVQAHQDYSCSGAPILDENKNVIGCLNLTGKWSEVHPHTLGLVTSAVDSIEKELRIKTANRQIKEISAQRNSIIEAVPTGLILLNNNDTVVQINKAALNILKMDRENLMLKNIHEKLLFESKKHHTNFFSEENEFYNKEVDIYYSGIKSIPIRIDASMIFVNNPDGTRFGTLLRLRVTEELHKLVNKISGFNSKFTFESIIGQDVSIKDTIELSKKAAKTDANILIQGESGTGKELFAQSIHNESEFRNGPFVAVNCGAIPNNLIESELFGYEKGAFTGANKDGNPGKFELADNGTIFLDEIGDMPLNVQAILLRVLQNKEIIRIGGKYPKRINVRIISATNRNLYCMIKDSTFREDLFYRLNIIGIQLPSLRDRNKDIYMLADYFLQKMNNNLDSNFVFSNDALDYIKNYDWPGNIRELEGAIQRAVTVAGDDLITKEHFVNRIGRNDLNLSNKEDKSIGDENSIPYEGANEEETIINAIKTTSGNMIKTARILGMSRRTLYRRIDKYNINPEDYR